MSLRISNGVIRRAQRVVIYGCEGIGKTTLASRFPDPLFIDTEGGTARMNVNRVDGVENWDQLIATVREVSETNGICRTLVIDTADWAEASCIQSLCARNGWKSIEEPGYGKGYTYIGEEFGRLLKECDKVISAGIHVVITAHAKMRKFEQPDEMGAYDRWEMKLSRQVYPLLKEWADMVLFLNYKTIVVKADDSKGASRKAQGGERVMYTCHHPCWDAKNRHDLPPELPMEYERIAACFGDVKTPADGLRERMLADGVGADQLTAVLVERGKLKEGQTLDELPANLINTYVLKHWEKILSMIKEAR